MKIEQFEAELGGLTNKALAQVKKGDITFAAVVGVLEFNKLAVIDLQRRFAAAAAAEAMTKSILPASAMPRR